MTSNSTGLRSRGARAAIYVAAVAMPVLLAQLAVAQQAPQPPEPAPPAAQPMNESRGLFEQIGRWFDQSAAGLRSHMLGATDNISDLNQRAATTTKNLGDSAVEVGKNAVDAGVATANATRDAVGAVAKLPMTRVVIGRERCEVAPNGAPDCLAAADTLCRKKGFSTGKSMDFTSAELCPARVMLHGRESEADCITVTFINRAMCQ